MTGVSYKDWHQILPWDNQSKLRPHLEKFWKWLISQGAKKIDDIRGGFDNEYVSALLLGDIIFMNNTPYNILYGSKQKLKNTDVWKQKSEGKMNIEERIDLLLGEEENKPANDTAEINKRKKAYALRVKNREEAAKKDKESMEAWKKHLKDNKNKAKCGKRSNNENN